ASAKDPDAGSTVTYTIDDSRFAINSSTGVVTRSGTGSAFRRSQVDARTTRAAATMIACPLRCSIRTEVVETHTLVPMLKPSPCCII
ncbi:MAG: cadherin repeat domain-containing protein, partial [Mesorhizobium sp.]